MSKFKDIKAQLIATTRNEKISTEERLKNGNLNERINKAEAIVLGDKVKNKPAVKVVRDAFTMLRTDVEALKEIKKKCQRSGIDANKSLIVRAGIQAIYDMPPETISQLFDKIEKVKVGRPKIIV